MVTRRNAFAAGSAERSHEEVKKLREEHFDTTLKCCAYKAITKRLLAEKLITQGEANEIGKRIAAMEATLVAAPKRVLHSRTREAA